MTLGMAIVKQENRSRRITRLVLTLADDARLHLLAVLVLTTVLVIRSLYTYPDHDEDQYVAGAVLAAEWMIFQDFMHVQTPLQALLFAPLTKLFQGNVFVTLRVANALVAGASLFVLFRATRLAGASSLAAIAAAVMCGMSQPF